MIKVSKHPIMQHMISLRYGWWPKVHIAWEHHNPTASGWVPEIWDRILFTYVSRYRIAHLCLRFFPYPSTQPRSNSRPGQVSFHHSSHKSGTFPFTSLTLSCSLGKHYVHDVTLGHSRAPNFRGEANVMTSRQPFIYRCNPVYVWDKTSGCHDKRGPVSVASNFATM
jgi:hypothetical protein